MLDFRRPFQPILRCHNPKIVCALAQARSSVDVDNKRGIGVQLKGRCGAHGGKRPLYRLRKCRRLSVAGCDQQGTFRFQDRPYSHRDPQGRLLFTAPKEAAVIPNGLFGERLDTGGGAQT